MKPAEQGIHLISYNEKNNRTKSAQRENLFLKNYWQLKELQKFTI